MNKIVRELIWLGGTAIYKHWFKLKYYGRENLPQNQGYIIVANHTSHLDAPAIIAAHGQHLDRFYSLAAQDYFFNHPVKSWFCHNWFNMIPFKRRGNFLDCLPACQEVIKQRKSILFFPEGTRSVTGTLQPLKLGIGILAIALDVPLVPAFVRGTYQALPKGKYLPKRYPIQVTFGSPLEFNHLRLDGGKSDRANRQIYHTIADDVFFAIQKLQKAMD